MDENRADSLERSLNPHLLLKSLCHGHVELIVFDGHDYIPVLVVSEYLRPCPMQTVEGFWGRVPVPVVRTDLDHGHLRWEAVQEDRGGRRGRPVVRDLEKR